MKKQEKPVPHNEALAQPKKKKKKKERKKKKMKKSQFEHRQMGYKSHILNYYASFYLCDIRIANKINLLCLQSSFAGLLS